MYRPALRRPRRPVRPSLSLAIVIAAVAVLRLAAAGEPTAAGPAVPLAAHTAVARTARGLDVAQRLMLRAPGATPVLSWRLRLDAGLAPGRWAPGARLELSALAGRWYTVAAARGALGWGCPHAA